MHPYLKLTLRRNAVEATSTCVTLHSDYAKAVAGILADTLESGKCVIIDKGFKSFCLLTDLLLLLTSL